MSNNILLIQPKLAHNVGAAIRAASCFGGGRVLWTGDRFDFDNLSRLPREERMKGYRDVDWGALDHSRPVSWFTKADDLIPVAIELVPSSIPLPHFTHPERALYVFGPEDGSLPKGIRQACHSFVTIPTFHCTNLAAAAYMVLYDRMIKRVAAGLQEMPTIDGEQRGWWHSPSMEGETA